MSVKSPLTIEGFKKLTGGTLSGSLGSFVLQLSPSALSLNYDVSGSTPAKSNEEPKSALGDPTNPQTLARARESISFSFILDTTGAITKNSSVKDILTSVKTIRSLTVDKVDDTHAPPFVSIKWGSISFTGKVRGLDVEYTLFSATGTPLRAKIKLSASEEIEAGTDSRNNRSPDITRIPTIRDGDSLVSLSADYYDDPQFFLRVARFNNLVSFRRLKAGSSLEFPPLEK